MINVFSVASIFFTLLISYFYSASALAVSNSNSGEVNCVACHQSAVSAWQQSDHAKAMAIATDKTVLGNFNNSTTTHFSQSARFYKNNQQFFMELKLGEKSTSYQIQYTFGHYPLQQYLTKTSDGKFQVLPYSWDSRPEKSGGQRWFVINDNSEILQTDRLHWQQPLQNWNGMCADCHSDGLKRNYNAEKAVFDTKFDNINVGCQSCHADMTEHASKNKQTNGLVAKNSRNQPEIVNKWLRKVGEKTASWHGKKRDNSFMDTCFACHSFRSPVTDGIDPSKAFLDQFSPSFITYPLYEVDGQIKEEVFVYGSFLQSKMYKAGVNCIDCHDPHTMQVKAQDNGLCLQCHSAEEFNQVSHFKHEVGSAGSMCVNCHMPTARYMGVDDRRDHSFKIPRPDLSIKHNTPNACTNCHEDKDNLWAANTLKAWHGKPKTLSITYADFLTLQKGLPLNMNQHLAIIEDESLNDIVRATAIAALPNTTTELPNHLIKPWVASNKPLIRLAIAKTGHLVPKNQRHLDFSRLLSDEYQSIRVAAANHLVGNLNVDVKLLKSAFNELMTANDINKWRGEGHLNDSLVQFTLGKPNKVIAALKNAIKVDPYFSSSYINLADIYKALGDTVNEAKVFQQVLNAAPNDGLVHYSYGLFLIRNKAKEDAVAAFKQAVALDPSNSQFIYLYALAQDSLGNTELALNELKNLIKEVNNPRQLAQLGMSFAQKLKDRNSFQYFRNIMR